MLPVIAGMGLVVWLLVVASAGNPWLASGYVVSLVVSDYLLFRAVQRGLPDERVRSRFRTASIVKSFFCADFICAVALCNPDVRESALGGRRLIHLAPVLLAAGFYVTMTVFFMSTWTLDAIWKELPLAMLCAWLLRPLNFSGWFNSFSMGASFPVRA